jgi:hypothetical protein
LIIEWRVFLQDVASRLGPAIGAQVQELKDDHKQLSDTVALMSDSIQRLEGAMVAVLDELERLTGKAVKLPKSSTAE